MADENKPVHPDQGDQNTNQGDAAPESPADLAANAPVGQDEIEGLLNRVSQKAEAASAAGPPQSSQAAQSTVDGDTHAALGQDDIDRLLGEANPALMPAAPNAVGTTPARDVVQSEVNPADIECLLDQAEEALRSIDSKTGELPPGVLSFQFREFAGATPSAETATLDLISDVELDVKIELGRTHMYLEDVLKLRRGAVVPLDKLAGDPVDIYVNGRLIARGEVLVLNDNFCVRVAELIAGANLE